MEKFIRLFTLLTLLTVLTLATSCCKDECKDKVRTSAAFTMKYGVGDTTIALENGDTVRKGTTISFEANDVSDNTITYSWKIGTDPRVFTKNKFELEFDDVGKIDVQLILKKSPNLDCFPDDDGIDTIRQSFFLVDTILTLGKYEGFVENRPNQKFTVELIWNLALGRTYLDNLPNGCIRTNRDWTEVEYSANYRDVQIGYIGNTGKVCPGIYGYGKLAKDNSSFTINYVVWNELQQKFVYEKFIGIKK